MIGAVRRFASRVRWNVVWDTFDVFVREVREEDREFVAPAGYEFAFAAPDEVAAMTEHHTELGAADREHGRRRLELGHRLVVGRHDGVAVFTMWINPRNLNVPGFVKRALAEDEVFIYKAYTSPDHRGKKLYQAGMRFVLADLAARGMRRLVGYAHVTKDVSRAGLARLDFHAVGTFRGRGYRRPFHVSISKELAAAFPRAVPRSGLDLT
ncbi:MAG: hypothetical protein R3F34_01220 [Planctomycetota bacterium]